MSEINDLNYILCTFSKLFIFINILQNIKSIKSRIIIYCILMMFLFENM